MTQDEIDDLARQARNIWSESKTTEGMSFFLNTFAKLVAAKEREACAKVCEEHGKVWAERFLLGYQATLDDAADAIRARGEA